MNIFEKIQEIKAQIKNTVLKKSGQNKFSNYSYFELTDFLPIIIDLCNDYKVYTQINFNKEDATLTIINTENPEEVVLINSPIAEAQLKGCSPVQNLGAMQTYLRRYLFVSAFDIIENDIIDNSHNQNEPIINKQVKEDKQWLNPDTETWSKAIDFLKKGGVIAEVEKKYRISKENKIKLEGSI